MTEPIRIVSKNQKNGAADLPGKVVPFRKKPQLDVQTLSFIQERFNDAVKLEERPETLDHAITIYQEILQLNPNYAEAYINLGTIHYNQKDFVEAENLYRKATEANPNYALAWFDLGNVLDETQKFDRAVEAYERAITINPKYADAHYNLAQTLEIQNKHRDALTHWKIYAELDPTGPWSKHARLRISTITGLKVVKPEVQEPVYKSSARDWFLPPAGTDPSPQSRRRRRVRARKAMEKREYFRKVQGALFSDLYL